MSTRVKMLFSSVLIAIASQGGDSHAGKHIFMPPTAEEINQTHLTRGWGRYGDTDEWGFNVISEAKGTAAKMLWFLSGDFDKGRYPHSTQMAQPKMVGAAKLSIDRISSPGLTRMIAEYTAEGYTQTERKNAMRATQVIYEGQAGNLVINEEGTGFVLTIPDSVATSDVAESASSSE